MKESVTYQAIVEEGIEKGLEQGLEKGLEMGYVEGQQRFLLRVGGKRFGPPDAATQAVLGAIASREELERLIDRILDVESWSELLSQT